jgi:hypothetical protein
MEKLQCKACGSFGLIPMDVAVEDADEDLGLQDEAHESRFYTCQVCGDNWLSVKATGSDGDCQITFIHQMGMQPVLKRVAHMDQSIVIAENTVGAWEYYLGDQAVHEEVWRTKLDNRRAMLKSICSN